MWEGIHWLSTLVKRVPFIKNFVSSRGWKVVRYKITALTSQRRNCHYTCFYRLPSQLDALVGPVVEFFLKDNHEKCLRIVVLGCSNGAEAYSIASVLRTRHPTLAFTIDAYDIDEACISHATKAQYTQEEVFGNSMITEDFVNATFIRGNACYTIKPDVRREVHFEVANALTTNLLAQIGKADIVFAQHFLIHLSSKDARKAFDNISQLLNPKAALFIAGVDLDILQKLTKEMRLAPLDYKIESIHNEVAIYGQGWPYSYWTSEPFLTIQKDWKRRYSTIFFKQYA